MKDQTLILTHKQILQKLQRMSYQVYERNFDENEILLCGINERGYFLAEKLQKSLKKIAPFKVELYQVFADKKSLEIINQPELKGKTVILVDDVLHTGNTMSRIIVHLINGGVKKLETWVLAERDFRKFPITANYVGISLATTIQEHVHFNLDDKKNLIVYTD